MKKFIHLSLMATSIISAAHAGPNVIYGKDNRVEVYEATVAQQLLAKSTAIMISKNDMTRDTLRPGLVQFNQKSLKEWIESSEEIKSKRKMFSPSVDKAAAAGITFCEGTRFVDQPNPGMCSGFLIAPDLLVTAGHCVAIDNFCDEFQWVFDYEMDKTTQKAGVDVKEENIYKCDKVVSTALMGMFGLDYGVVKLNRPVKGRAPLEIRSEAKIADAQSVLVIGGPSGLPTKVAGDAFVRTNTHPNFFTSNLDTFQGNSGSAVFNAETGTVEGILVRGEDDYLPNMIKQCIEANVCESDACRGEDASRLTSIPEVANQKALYAAAVSGNIVNLTAILTKKIWIDFYTKDGQSALIKASAAAQNESIKLLLAKGANIKLKDATGSTVLHAIAATLSESNADALNTLIEKGAAVEEKNEAGDTALLIAGKKLNLAGAKLLIKAGADKNAVDANGENVLISFVKQGDDRSVLELVDLGVDAKPAMKIASRSLRVKLLLKKIVNN